MIVLSYTCKRLGCVATSTPEAEIVSAERCVRKDLVPLSLLFAAVLRRFPAMILGEDNDTCKLALERGASKEIRHVSRSQRVSLASLTRLMRLLSIALLRVDSKDMLADIFTKLFSEAPRWFHALFLAGLTSETDETFVARILGVLKTYCKLKHTRLRVCTFSFSSSSSSSSFAFRRLQFVCPYRGVDTCSASGPWCR